MPEAQKSPLDPAEVQPVVPSVVEASKAPSEGEPSSEAFPPAEESRSRFRETLGRARNTLGNARDMILGTDSFGGELKKVGTAAKDVALNVPGTQLRALGNLLTLHPVKAAKTEIVGLLKTAADLKAFTASSFRATAKGTGNMMAAPFQLAGGAGRAAVGGARMAGRSIAATAAAPVHLAEWAGKGLLNAPLRAFNAITSSLARVHDGVVSTVNRTLAMVPGAAPA